MVVVHCAYTEPINVSGTSPTLTREQIWKGLQRKIRRAYDFVPVIDACDVIEDKGDEVIREAHFKDFGGMKPHTVREVCKSYYPCRPSEQAPLTALWVDFHQPDGSVITNTISDGDALDGKDLNMTYTFEWRYPDMKEGSEEHKKKLEEHRGQAKQAVHSSIEALRRLGAAGDLD